MNEPRDTDDRALLERVARADAAALEVLYDRHAGRLLALGTRLLGERSRAEDVLHDVLLEVWHRSADHDPDRGTVRAWLVVRMRSRCLDRLRSETRRDGASTAFASEPAHRGAIPDVGLDDERVRGAIAALPKVQREVVELLWMRGLSSSEAAHALGCPVGTVKSRARLGLQMLRRAFDAQGTP